MGRKEISWHPFRYCPRCGRLERKFPKWHEYPRRQINPLTGEEGESLGYHKIVKTFDPSHEVPKVEEELPTPYKLLINRLPIHM